MSTNILFLRSVSENVSILLFSKQDYLLSLCRVESFQNGSTTSKAQIFLVLVSELSKRIMLMLSKMGIAARVCCHHTKSHLCFGPVTFHNSFCSIIVHTESLLLQLVLLHQEQEAYTLWHKLPKCLIQTVQFCSGRFSDKKLLQKLI